MSTDDDRLLAQDHRRLRWLFLAAALSLLAALSLAGARALTSPWRTFQAQYKELTGAPGPDSRIVQHKTCAETLDRCTTCHLGSSRKDLARADVPLPLRAHGKGLGRHDVERLGCGTCHGGSGRALNAPDAHRLPGSAVWQRDPLMKQPHVQASCARCHVPGAKPGQDRLVQGARLFLALGCPVCHPLSSGGRGGFDFGPDLTAIGRKSPEYLKTSLLDPAANFAGSTMPSFRHALNGEPIAATSLIIYLESLVLEPLPACNDKSLDLVDAPCATCHAGAAGKAFGRLQHRCVYLLDRKKELRCANCHAEGVPTPGPGRGECPVITAERQGACVVCHDEAKNRGATP